MLKKNTLKIESIDPLRNVHEKMKKKKRNHHLHFISSEQIIYPHARLTRTCPQVHVILKCSMLSIFIVFYIRITS